MLRIISVVGARPQFIKAAMVSRIIRTSSNITEVLVHTGQHYDQNMSDLFFQELGIPQPKHNLGIGSGSHGYQTGRMIERLEQILIEEKPDGVIVYGDTNSTMAGALAAVKLHVPVAHIEAGLRSYNREMPEEINRIVTDHVSDLLFAPSQAAVNNLKEEGLRDKKVHLVGDVMYDAVKYYGDLAEKKSGIRKSLDLHSTEYILATIHRAENTDNSPRLRSIFEGLLDIADNFQVVMPLHPRTEEALSSMNLLEEISNRIQITDPVGYLDMMSLEKNARAIITDSGGIQKEAFFHRVPCITLREETEWVELIDLGWNHLIPPLTAQQVIKGIKGVLDSNLEPSTSQPYGDGRAAEHIIQRISMHWHPSDG